MHVVITGGAGFIGKKLARALLDRGQLTGPDGHVATIDKLVIADLAAPEPGTLPDDPRLDIRTGDFSSVEAVDRLLSAETGVVFHLAAVVSGGAEADFELGMQVNLHGSMHLLEACRRLEHCPKLVFASSVAVYGGDMPDVIEDRTALNPQTSYGAQKAAVELLVNDYSRRGFIDGRALRLPTIVVRPGKPNKAASSFASSIIREPLQGQDYVCPVSDQTGVWVLSPRRVVDAFIHGAELPAADWGPNRAVALPGLTVTVREMVDTMGAVAGERVAARVSWQPDPAIEKIVYGWATRFRPERGRALGFQTDDDFAAIVSGFIEDELGGDFAR